MIKEKVMIGMSGGVDSSVAAALLLEKGYDVIGITMKIWPDYPRHDKFDEGGCCSLTAVDDARRVANSLGIPYYVMNFQEIFEEKVINYFIEEYQNGRTPNPCIACNKFIRFDLLLKKAKAMGISYIATGHYARIKFSNQHNRYLLLKSADPKKDQSYVLFNLTQDQLKHTLFPLGGFQKDETRRIAKEIGLSVASKPDSQEICFIPDNNYSRFIEVWTGKSYEKGHFVDRQGNVLGEHKGLINYTIGQRKGLGIALGKPMYVVGIDAKNNRVILGESGEEFSSQLIANHLNFIPFERLDNEIKVMAKIRYGIKESPATVRPYIDGQVHVTFETPQRAITPGQSVVFYDDDIVVGGGVIIASGDTLK